MSIDISDIRSLSVETLVQELQDQGIDNAGNFSASELVFELACQRSKGRNISINGILEILPEGFGFLRSPVSEYAPGADDAYVSPAQIRRFNLRTGDHIQGEARIPREKERYFALLRINRVNGRSPEVEKNRMNFDTKTVDRAEEKLACSSGFPVDIFKGQRAVFLLERFYNSRDLLLQLTQNLRDRTILIALNYPIEDLAIIRRVWDGEIFASTRGASGLEHCQILDIGLERAKRLTEQGADINLLIFSLNDVALGEQSVKEQAGKAGASILGIEYVLQSLAIARNFVEDGSITVLAGLNRQRSTFEQRLEDRVLSEVEHRIVVSGSASAITFHSLS